MTTSFLVQLAYLAAAVAVPVTIVSLLAVACLNRRAPRLFVYSMLVMTCVAALAVVVVMRWLLPYPEHISIGHLVLGAFLSWGPLFLLPGAFVLGCVKGSLSRRWIPILATLGVVLSLPIGFILGALVQ